ncbi:amidase [Paenibacillus periandrae]|uniref:amidase n=1 Tax=Paenibacillus periandrae TaxID=1761741 RepID=UPI001F094474|nr:amidase [Paenibacillus periandrae]
MTESHFTTLTELGEGYLNKKFSPTEIVRSTLARIERLQPELNAFIHVMSEQALEQAEVLEKEMLKGEIRGPLHGVPVAVKDMIQTKGVRTTAGSRVLEHWIPDEDATVVTRLKKAGVILVGKANMHEFAMGATSENPHYGDVRNPWNQSKIAGGSSGGSAVSVAAGMSTAALGSDTAGSIRLPSALCGIVGFKPTYGSVSRHGSIPFSWSLDHIGPMARTVEDAALVWNCIAGFDSKDPATSKRKIPSYTAPQPGMLKGKKIGVCQPYFFENVNEEISLLLNRALERFRELGAEIIEIELPGLDQAQQALRVIAQSEGNSFHKPIYSLHPEWYGEDVQYRLQFGQQVSAEQYLQAQKTRNVFIRQVLGQMQGIDALVSPMNHNPPFAIGSVVPADAINNMFRLAKAPLANLLGFPAVSVPCGFMQEGLPAGMQLIGKPFADTQLLQIAQLYEQTEQWTIRSDKLQSYVKLS